MRHITPLIRPFTSAHTYRRWAYLVIGGALLMPYAMAALVLATLITQHGQPVEATETPTALAYAIATVLGTTTTVAATAYIPALRALAATQPAARAVSTLTEREAQTLTLMAKGLTNAEIATHLFLGIQTIKTHVSNILAKLNARDRTQAVIAAYDAGLIRPNTAR